MSSLEAETLMTRIRRDYREMPGLQLTFAQARVLWHLDDPMCSALLQMLVDEGFLVGRSDGRFIAASTNETPPRRGA